MEILHNISLNCIIYVNRDYQNATLEIVELMIRLINLINDTTFPRKYFLIYNIRHIILICR